MSEIQQPKVLQAICYNVTQQEFTPVLFNEKNTELDNVLDQVCKIYK